MIWLNDPKTKEPSVTLTAFVGGFIVALGKLAVSGLVVRGVTLPQFTGTDFGVVVAALGGVYCLRRHQSNGKEDTE